MFAELSLKKISRVFLVSATIIFAVQMTYSAGRDYLSGFSASYYGAALRNAYHAEKYKIELTYQKKGGILATLSNILHTGSTFTVDASGEARSIPVLLYHGIVNKPDGNRYNVTHEQFKEQMFALKNAGYDTVSISELMSFLTGTKQLPQKSFVLTFDDGQKNSFYNADPVLQATGYNAVMFIIAGKSLGQESLRSTYYLTEWELKRMLHTGRWEIQSHGKEAHSKIAINGTGEEGYFYADKLWLAKESRLETDEEFRARVQKDLAASKEELETRLGIPVTALAFPFGEFGQESLNFPGAKLILSELAASIYPMSFYQFKTGNRFAANYLHANTSTDGHFLVKRIEARSNWTPEHLHTLLGYALAKSLPFQDDFSSHTGWFPTWGEATSTSDGLLMRAPAGATGGVILLDGSRPWSNYTFRANILWRAGSNVYLWARFQDDDNFVACNFSSVRTHVEQKYNGELRVIRGANTQAPIPKGALEIGIRVSGRTVECLVDNKISVASDFLEQSLDSGGIGIKIWDAIPNTSEIVVERVYVENEEYALPTQ